MSALPIAIAGLALSTLAFAKDPKPPKGGAGAKPPVAYFVCVTPAGTYFKGDTAVAAAELCKKAAAAECKCDAKSAAEVRGPYPEAQAKKWGGSKGYDYCAEKIQKCYDKQGTEKSEI